MKSLVSIGLPVFNDAAFLPAALDSLLAQTFTEFELIISDDGSTDGSEGICREYASRDSRIRYSRQPENLGVAKNMMFVLKQAQGEYFMWAGDDDVWHPRFIETLHDELGRTPGAITGFTPMYFIDEAGERIVDRPIRRTDYSGATSYARLKKLVRIFDDAFGYGLFHRESIKDVQFPTWWWVNKSRASNNIYPTLCYYLAKGDFVLAGTTPMYFKRLKSAHNAHHHTPYSTSFVRGFLAFLLWKVNLVTVSLRQVARAGHPWTALRLAPTMTAWWVLAASKRQVTRRLWPGLRRGEISLF